MQDVIHRTKLLVGGRFHVREVAVFLSLAAFGCADALSYGAPPRTIESQQVVDPRIYVTHYRAGAPLLHTMNPRGGDVQSLKTLPAETPLIVGIQVDLDSDTIYWTDGDHKKGKICRSRIDGSEMRTLLSGLTNPRGLALDAGGKKLYWSDTQDNVMYRANLDGTGMEVIVDLKAQLGRPTLDLKNDKLYFGKFGPPWDPGEIRRAELDGSNQEVLIKGKHLATPIAIALDIENRRLYWADSNTGPNWNYIASATLDGLDIRTIYQGRNESSGLTGIAIDPFGKTVFWTDEIGDGEKGLWRADLDGANRKLLFASPQGCSSAAMTLVWP